MLTITRRQALLFRTVLKNALLEQEPRREWPLVVLRGDVDGLTFRAQKGEVAVCWQLPGPPQEGTLVFRATVLCELEARNDEPVTLDEVSPGKALARWQQGVVPRDWEFETVSPDGVPVLPPLPKKLVPFPDRFVRALADAALVTAEDNTRFALTKIQLRGKAGEVNATDGKQLLVCRGFEFPWQDDVLIPRLPALERKGLLPASPVEIGRTDKDLALRLGSWLFLLRLDTQSRFPQIHGAIPDRRGVTCTLHLGPAAARLLLAALPKLPAEEPKHFPITLVLGDKVCVRAQPLGSERPTEIDLPDSRIEGEPVVICVNRLYLLRALDLGFRTLEACQPDQPLVCREADRLYEWLPLPPQDALAANSNTVPTTAVAGDASLALPDKRRRLSTMSPPANGRSTLPAAPENGAEPDNGVPLDPLAEAEELRRLLQECGGRLSRLTASLRQQRRQSRVFRQAITSLRQLDLDA